MSKKVKVYVYPLEGTAEERKQKAQGFLGSPLWHWVADAAELLVNEGMPTEWKSQGAIFNERGELRWWECDGTYKAVLISENPVSEEEPLPGQWEYTIESVFLQSLKDKRVRPNFAAYPGDKEAGRIEVRMCFRNGMAVFVSPRRFEEG